MKLLSNKKKQSRMCPQGNCPFQQAAPSAIEIAQGAVTRLRLYPTACVSEPGVWDMAHRLLHATAGPAVQRLQLSHPSDLEPSPVSSLNWAGRPVPLV